jgi:hypothetical protein
LLAALSVFDAKHTSFNEILFGGRLFASWPVYATVSSLQAIAQFKKLF